MVLVTPVAEENLRIVEISDAMRALLTFHCAAIFFSERPLFYPAYAQRSTHRRMCPL